MNLIVDWLEQHHFEVTPENYLSLAYPDTDPAYYTEDMLDEWREVRKAKKDDWQE